MQLSLENIKNPAHYTGNEWNMIKKDPAHVAVRFAFCFPDTYDVGMSHLGLKLLYDILNRREDCYCERAFAPWPDREAALRQAGVKLATLETETPLCDFDIIGFTLQYELSFSNILQMLDLGGIPMLCADRGDMDSIVIAGGPCACNPDPLADFIDLFMLGDGEEVIGQIVEHVKTCRAKGLSRRATLILAAQTLRGVYAPGAYGGEPIPGVPATVTRCVIPSLEESAYPDAFVVPYAQAVHDRVVLEVFRGCTRGCRFCQAGMLYRPIRERSVDTLMRQAHALVDSTGYDEIGLCSLSTGDYSGVRELLPRLVNDFAPQGVSLSLPSMRLDAMPGDYLAHIAAVRKSGLTFAPEAGSQRLRDVINKNITHEDFLDSLRQAYQAGWSQIKLYFMIGLPTETQEDLQGIVDLVRESVALFRQTPPQGPRKPLSVSVSVSTFVPKPHTPFQWFGQNTMEEIQQKQQFLRGALRFGGVRFSSHDPKVSMLEAAFARGDRALGHVLLAAYQLGCRFDGWSEHFNLERWRQAFEACGSSVEAYAQKNFEKEESMPWDAMDYGITREFLWREYAAAMLAETTPDCRNGCHNCGVSRIMEGGCCMCG